MIIKTLIAYDCASGYTISEYGNVYRNGKELSQHIDHNGYYQVRIFNKNNKRISVLVHRLVAFTFLTTPSDLYVGGNSKSGYTVDHIDKNKLNNHYTNLRWISFYENIKHSTYFDYMDDEKAKLIIQDLQNLYSIDELVKKYNVSKMTIQRIRQKKRYKHLTNNITFPKTRIHRKRDEMLTIIYYVLKYNNKRDCELSVFLNEKLGIQCSISMIGYLKNNSSCQDYIKFVQNNNWKPSETIEMK